MNNKKFYILLLIVWVIYATLTLLAPSSQTIGKYNVSLTKFNLLRLTLIIPILFTWIAAMFGVLRFRNYTKLIQNSEESAAFRLITKALWILLLVLVIPSLLGLISSYQPQTQKAIVIIRTYFNVVSYFAAFWFLLQASRKLKSSVTHEKNYRIINTVTMFVMAVIAVAYILAVFQNEYRTVSADPMIRPTYYLHDVLIMVTIVIPYILAWLVGSFAALNFYIFAKHVKGVIYRKAFSYVAFGLATIILLSIGLQFLVQSSAFLGYAGLGVILLLVYALLIVIGVGYLLLARGASLLTSIEEV